MSRLLFIILVLSPGAGAENVSVWGSNADPCNRALTWPQLAIDHVYSKILRRWSPRTLSPVGTPQLPVHSGSDRLKSAITGTREEAPRHWDALGISISPTSRTIRDYLVILRRFLAEVTNEQWNNISEEFDLQIRIAATLALHRHQHFLKHVTRPRTIDELFAQLEINRLRYHLAYPQDFLEFKQMIRDLPWTNHKDKQQLISNVDSIVTSVTSMNTQVILRQIVRLTNTHEVAIDSCWDITFAFDGLQVDVFEAQLMTRPGTDDTELQVWMNWHPQPGDDNIANRDRAQLYFEKIKTRLLWATDSIGR